MFSHTSRLSLSLWVLDRPRQQHEGDTHVMYKTGCYSRGQAGFRVLVGSFDWHQAVIVSYIAGHHHFLGTENIAVEICMNEWV
jgi:hypothetical protein